MINVHEVGHKPVTIYETAEFFAGFVGKPHDTIPFTGTCKEVPLGGGEIQKKLYSSMEHLEDVFSQTFKNPFMEWR